MLHERCRMSERFLTEESIMLHERCRMSERFLTEESIMLHEEGIKSERFFRAEFILHQNCAVRMNQIPETNKYQTPNFCHFFLLRKSLFLVPSFLFFFIDLSTLSLRSLLYLWFIFCLTIIYVT